MTAWEELFELPLRKQIAVLLLAMLMSMGSLTLIGVIVALFLTRCNP